MKVQDCQLCAYISEEYLTTTDISNGNTKQEVISVPRCPYNDLDISDIQNCPKIK